MPGLPEKPESPSGKRPLKMKRKFIPAGKRPHYDPESDVRKIVGKMSGQPMRRYRELKEKQKGGSRRAPYQVALHMRKERETAPLGMKKVPIIGFTDESAM